MRVRGGRRGMGPRGAWPRGCELRPRRRPQPGLPHFAGIGQSPSADSQSGSGSTAVARGRARGGPAEGGARQGWGGGEGEGEKQRDRESGEQGPGRPRRGKPRDVLGVIPQPPQQGGQRG